MFRLNGIKFILFICILGVCIHNSVLEKDIVDKCGRRFSRKQPSTTPAPSTTTVATGPQIGRIVGGQDARSGDMPWLISIQKVTTKDGEKKMSHFCGGSLINKNFVITAAHCFFGKNYSPDMLIIKSGSLQIAKDAPGGYHDVAEIIMYEDFSTVHYSHDIALLKLKQPIRFTKGAKFGKGSVWPICLPPKIEDYYGAATVAGWGLNHSESRVAMAKLQAADVNLFDCKNATCLCHSYTLFREVIMICAGYKGGKIDACQGDSGGPLMSVQADKNGERLVVLIGVVSYGEGCAEEAKPGVYAKVGPHLDWIEEKIKPDKVYHKP